MLTRADAILIHEKISHRIALEMFNGGADPAIATYHQHLESIDKLSEHQIIYMALGHKIVEYYPSYLQSICVCISNMAHSLRQRIKGSP